MKMNFGFNCFGLLAAGLMGVFFAQGCSHGALDKKIDEEVAQESTVKTHNDLTNEGTQVLNSAQGLSAEQKQKLKDLRTSVTGQLADIYEKSLRLRSVLIKDLVAKDYNEDEVELIKSRIKYNEDKRLSLMFEAVDKAKTILGRNIEVNRHIVEDFMEGGHGGRE